MGKTTIEWATRTLNFYTWNCTPLSTGCRNCYAAELSKRYGGNSSNGGDFLKHAPAWRDNAMAEYKRLKAGDVVFVNSMSDTYHEAVPFEWIKRIHEMAYQRQNVVFLLLTKRPNRALELSPQLSYPSNLWIGTSVETTKYLNRLDSLLQIPAAGHFLSAEPLIGPLDGLDEYLYPTEKRAALGWVIVGGESGANYRPFDKAWAIDIQKQCAESNTAFMFKQGSAFKSGQDRILLGREWNETPFKETIEVVPEPYQKSLF